jgi:hypothetical protein
MTFGQMIGQVQTAMAEWLLSKESLHTVFRDNVEQWVQQGIYRLDADLQWTQGRLAFDTTASTRRYTMNAAILRVQHVTCDGVELFPLIAAEDIAKQELDDTEDTPAFYSWYGAEIALYPTPSGDDLEIEVWCNQTPAALSNDDDVPTLPPHTHALIVDYALYQAFRHVGEMEKSQVCLAIYRAAADDERGNLLNIRGVSGLRRDSRVV